MSALKQRKIWALFLGAIIFAGVDQAAYAASKNPTTCANRIPITKLLGLKYKPENVHGLRLATYLAQNAYLRTGKKKIEIRDVNCKPISSFGLYSTDYPYGARYYEKTPGGGNHTATQLYAFAKKAGSSAILIESIKDTWIVVKDPRKEEGLVYDD